ncbi:DMT family transporter [Croceivirga sp. JEA036]|uniref:DMT family transporter n=1 Tax=Croceivirga sp. JEA036 TaxID=2721162 RepID=UPI001439E5A0|nr:DMT family transporter [Croceivirga sp. JEA036]NJB35883.1 DMT family transporter [Croceivirga sp. JEA036]
MLNLALSVLCSSLIFVVFKLFGTYKVQSLYAIVVNYFVACICGLLFYEGDVQLGNLTQTGWFYGTFALGVLFITIFNVMAKSSQVNGVAVTSVATKMSLAIPVVFALVVYKESLSFWQGIGILLALGAVYFASIKKKGLVIDPKMLLLPFLVFVGSGVIDTTIKYIQDEFLDESLYPIFSATVFGAAGTTGVIYLLINSRKVPLKLNLKNVVGGICLGIPNYFSIYFLLQALNNPNFNSASIFTINNVAVVMFTTLIGILLFKEKLLPKNWLGVGLAIISILLVALL